jgi:hypothetical protein
LHKYHPKQHNQDYSPHALATVDAFTTAGTSASRRKRGRPEGCQTAAKRPHARAEKSVCAPWPWLADCAFPERDSSSPRPAQSVGRQIADSWSGDLTVARFLFDALFRRYRAGPPVNNEINARHVNVFLGERRIGGKDGWPRMTAALAERAGLRFAALLLFPGAAAGLVGALRRMALAPLASIASAEASRLLGSNLRP